MERMLLVPTPDTGQERSEVRVVQDDDRMPVVVVNDEQGLLVLPVYERGGALAVDSRGLDDVALTGEVVLQLLATSDWDRVHVDGADPEA